MSVSIPIAPLKSSQPEVKKCSKRAVMRIGYTCDGEFDPYHADYEVCCGMFHTEKSGKVVAILNLAVGILSAIAMIVIGFYWILSVFALYASVSLIAVYGTLSHREAFLKPFLVVSAILTLGSFAFVILTGITIVWPQLAMSLQLQKMFTSNEANLQFIGLMVVLMLFMDCCAVGYSFWVLFLHYFYLRDKPRSIKVDPCRGKLRFAPSTSETPSIFFLLVRMFA